MATPDAQKVAIAKSIALNGSQGPAAYQQQQADLASQKSGAMDAAASRAGLINAPEAFLRQQAAQLSEPYSTSSGVASANAGALNDYLGALNSGHNNYLSELKAAAPLAQAQVDKASQGANLNQMLQLLSAKKDAQQWDWAQQDHAAKQAAVDKATSDTTTQQAGLNAIVNHPNTFVRSEGAKLIAAGSLPTALQALADDKVQKEIIKNGGDPEELRRLVVQYYDPTTFAALAKAPAAAAPAAAPTQNSGPGFSIPNPLDAIRKSFASLGSFPMGR